MNVLKELIYRFRGEVSTEKLIKRGLSIGKDFQREGGCIIDPSHCWLINIGDNVTIAPGVHILAHDASMYRETGYTKIAPVNIGCNVFIGAKAVILPGVTIGNNVVIGAGSVVTENIPNNSVAAGVPAKAIGSYGNFMDKHRQMIKESPVFGDEYTLRNKKISSEMKSEMLRKLKDAEAGYVK